LNQAQQGFNVMRTGLTVAQGGVMSTLGGGDFEDGALGAVSTLVGQAGGGVIGEGLNGLVPSGLAQFAGGVGAAGISGAVINATGGDGDTVFLNGVVNTAVSTALPPINFGSGSASGVDAEPEAQDASGADWANAPDQSAAETNRLNNSAVVDTGPTPESTPPSSSTDVADYQAFSFANAFEEAAFADVTTLLEGPDQSDAETSRLARYNQDAQVQRLTGFLTDLRNANNSDVVNNVDEFSDPQIKAYTNLLAEGSSPEEASRLAPLMAELAGDEDLQQLLNAGDTKTPADPAHRIRPADARAAAAYDAALAQMRGISSDDKAYKDAHEVGLLTKHRGGIDRLTSDIRLGVFGGDSAQAAEYRNVLVMGLLSKDVYFDQGISEILPEGVRRLTNSEVINLGVDPTKLNQNQPGESGYFAAVYKDEFTGKYILVNRGTEMGVDGRLSADMRTNAMQAAGLRTSQYQQALRATEALLNNPNIGRENLVVTGHSLGGGLASAQGVAYGLQTYTFNSAGLHVNTVAGYGVTDGNFASRSGNVSAYYVNGELVSLLQDQGRGLLMTGLRLIPSPWTRGGAAVLDALQVGPPAAGNRTSMPAVDNPQWGGDQTYQPGIPLSATQSLTNTLNLHGQSQVNYAMEAFFAKLLRLLLQGKPPGGK
jgi:hypothetical protein